VILKDHFYKSGLSSKRIAEKNVKIVFSFYAVVLRSLVKDIDFETVFLEPKNPVKKRVSSLLSLVSNTRLGLLIQPSGESQRKFSNLGDTRVLSRPKRQVCNYTITTILSKAVNYI